MSEKIKVKDLLPHASSKVATVNPEDSLEKVISSMIEDPQTEDVYVTDKEGTVIGVINLRTALRHLCVDCLPSRSSPHDILEVVSSETAEDLMKRKPVYVFPQDDLRTVLEKMIRYDVLEIAVVDKKRKIIGNLRIKEFIWPWIHAELE